MVIPICNRYVNISHHINTLHIHVFFKFLLDLTYINTQERLINVLKKFKYTHPGCITLRDGISISGWIHTLLVTYVLLHIFSCNTIIT